MNLHNFLLILNSLTPFLNNKEIEGEIWSLVQLLNKNNVIEIESDPCLLRFDLETRKLKQNCTHSKLHSFFISLSWISHLMMKDLENDFKKTLDDVLENLKKGNVIVEPDLEQVRKCTKAKKN